LAISQNKDKNKTNGKTLPRIARINADWKERLLKWLNCSKPTQSKANSHRGQRGIEQGLLETMSKLCKRQPAFRPTEIFVLLWFFTRYSNRQLHARVK